MFGSEVALLIGPPARPGLATPALAAIETQAFLSTIHKRLTRFDATSELSEMNASPSEELNVSPLLALSLRAAIWAAKQSNGLVDPTLVQPLEQAGYATSKQGESPAPLEEALEWAPLRRPARPSADSNWRRISVDQGASLVRRPAGVRVDSGGCGKGLAADLAADRLAGYRSFVVDAGGDLRIGGTSPRPRVVSIEHPLQARERFDFELASGAVATSGIAGRIWRQGAGFSHHLLDPSTGKPAWTGVIQATALASSALQAETLAKTALLSGPEGARRVLAGAGGVIVLDDGTVELVGSLDRAPGQAIPA